MRALATIVALAAVLSAHPASAKFVQQGSKLVGLGASGQSSQGSAVALSTDGNTAIIGGPFDADGAGAAWVFVRSNGVWTPQGGKLVGAGAITATPTQGVSVAVSSDGNTAIVGGPDDNSAVGAAWIFVRSNGVWQQGGKLVGSGGKTDSQEGFSVALSGDGNTALIGGPTSQSAFGEAWVFTRNGNGTWSEQGTLTPSLSASPEFGSSVALSFDGNTAIIGGPSDNTDVGAAWIFTRTAGVWSQFGNKLVGSPSAGAAKQGSSVAMSADGRTAVVGGPGDSSNVGAAWVFTFNNGTWTQQGPKLLGTNTTSAIKQGFSVGLSGDGNTLVMGAPAGSGGTGEAFVFTRVNGLWAPPRSIFGTNVSLQGAQGTSVAVSGDGSTVMIGGPGDNNFVGATWPFVRQVSHDLDADGKSDIIWRNSDGTLALWLMNGGQIAQVTAIGGLGTNWQLFGQRDFNSDHKFDLLWRDSNTGTVALWLMNGVQIAQSGAVAAIANNWSIVGTGAGCSPDCILWRDASTGTLALWLMNNFTIAGTQSLGAVPSNWAVVATDGTNIFFRDSNTGTLVEWLMNGFQVVGTINYGVVPSTWSIVGIGDFNADGTPDLLWRDNTGATAAWLLQPGEAPVGQIGGLGTVPTNWIVAETGDYNGDGYSDILWRDTSTGNTAIWFMNGLTISSTANLGVVPASWTVQGTNAD